MHRLAAALATGLLLAPVAGAQTLEIALDPTLSEPLGLDSAQVEREMDGLISDVLNLPDQDEWMSSMANALAISSKGIGVDYASNPQKFVAGGSIGSGVHSAGLTFSRGAELLPETGFSFQAAFMAGLNLGAFSGEDSAARRFIVFVHGASLGVPSSATFRGRMFNVGGNVMIKVIGGQNTKVVEWGGIDLTGGFEHATYVLSLNSNVPITAPIDGVDVTWNGTGTYDVTGTANTIPIEVSSNLRVLVFTGYLGGAYDLNTASASSNASMSGPVEAAAQGVDTEIGTASLRLDGAGDGDPGAARVFVGLQANAAMFKVYGQLNAGFNNAVGGHLGIRVAM